MPTRLVTDNSDNDDFSAPAPRSTSSRARTATKKPAYVDLSDLEGSD